MIDLLINIIAGKKDDHRSLFLRNELRSLIGPKGKNLKMLFYFTLLAYFAVTFAQAGLNYLGYRMDNPFTNWLTFPISADISERFDGITKTLDDYKDENLYSLDNVNGFMRYNIQFRNKDGVQDDYVIGRTFTSPKDLELLDQVLSGENLLHAGLDDLSVDSWPIEAKKRGVILTEELYSKIGCSRHDVVHAKHVHYFMELKVIAVVRSLPDRAQFMTSYELYWDLAKSGDLSEVWKFTDTGGIEFYCQTDDGVTIDAGDIARLSDELEEEDFGRTGFDLNRFETMDSLCGFNSILSLNFKGPASKYDYTKAYEVVSKKLAYIRPFVIEHYDLHALGDLSNHEGALFRSGSKINKYHSVTLHFDEVDSIREFRKRFFNDEEVDISLEQIESRENFNLVSILTTILALALILFTLVSIILFISNVLKAHLEKIKMNLGTFMAFGLSSDFLISGYIRSIIGIISVVSIAAVGVIFIIDVLDLPFHILTAAGMTLKEDFNEAFSVWNIWLFALIFLILILTWRNCRKLVRGVLKHAPSDLIYNRTS